MNQPKLHHYVPRFYLNYFLNVEKKLWVYDKKGGRAFVTVPNRIAAETHFYRLPVIESSPIDPLTIEKNLANLESQASAIISRLIAEVKTLAPTQRVTLSDEERLKISEFLATQYFRTLELRDLTLYLLQNKGIVDDSLSEEEQKVIQFIVLSESGLLEEFEESVHNAIWIFAKNTSHIPFITSDHPVCIKSGDNRKWLKGLGILRHGRYLVFPITPNLVLYCKEPTFWTKLKSYDLCVSPVNLDANMVHHENSGQAFMASRFLISCKNEFEKVKDFLPSIGTHLYASNANEDDLRAVEEAARFIEKRNK